MYYRRPGPHLPTGVTVGLTSSPPPPADAGAAPPPALSTGRAARRFPLANSEPGMTASVTLSSIRFQAASGTRTQLLLSAITRLQPYTGGIVTPDYQVHIWTAPSGYLPTAYLWFRTREDRDAFVALAQAALSR